jgi:hypothetical protein
MTKKIMFLVSDASHRKIKERAKHHNQTIMEYCKYIVESEVENG